MFSVKGNQFLSILLICRRIPSFKVKQEERATGGPQELEVTSDCCEILTFDQDHGDSGNADSWFSFIKIPKML